METQLPSKIVRTPFAAAIVTLLSGGAGAQQCALPQNCTQSSGNVGIGTTSPATKLHVLGTPGFAAAVATFEQPAGAMNFVELRSSTVGGNYGTDLMFRDSGNITAEIKSTANGQLRFATQGQRPDKVVIDGNGNVGIGIPTENPGRKLDVEGPIVAANGSRAFLVAADAGGSASLWTNASYNHGSPCDGWFRTLNMKDGHVGIGTRRRKGICT